MVSTETSAGHLEILSLIRLGTGQAQLLSGTWSCGISDPKLMVDAATVEDSSMFSIGGIERTLPFMPLVI